MRLASSVSVVLALGCGGQSLRRTTDENDGGASGSGPRGGSTGTGGRASGGGTGNGGFSNGGGTGSGGASNGGGGGGSTGICAKGTADYERNITNFFVAVDRSEAMAGARWSRALETLTLFFADPALAETRVALAPFPDAERACNDVTCSAEACGVPLVELGSLTAETAPADAQEDALKRTLRGLTPDGITGAIPAMLDGALMWAESHQSENPTERAHVILVTGGTVDACPPTAVESAARALEEQGILTYVLTFEDSDRALLEQIALSGGTNRALLLGPDPEENAADLVALTKPFGVDYACEFALPSQPSSGTIDLTDVSVFLLASGVSFPVAQLPGPEWCLDDYGWYFDDTANPMSVVLCPWTCADAVSGAWDGIELWVGCSGSE
jgi:hypothetical protein